MSNQFTELNVGSGGSVMDETGVTYGSSPVLRRRSRIILSGEGLNEIVEVKNTDLVGSEYGLVVRSLNSYPVNTVTEFDQNSAVSDNTETTIVSYTVGAGSTFYFTGIVSNGDLPGRFRVYVDANPILSFRTVSSAPSIQQSFSMPPFSATAGQVVAIKVIHYISGVTGDFEGTILGYVQ